VLETNPESINIKLLRQFPAYLQFIGKSAPKEESQATTPEAESPEEKKTPLELLDDSYNTLREATAEEMLFRLKSCSSAFFEKIVVKLLLAMGYGRITGEGIVAGKSGDQGIDGFIKEDKLGLGVVCIQAKRWEGSVGSVVVRNFVGSMQLHGTKKGVIITTSSFTRDAEASADKFGDTKVVLMDGSTLVNLMIDHNVGVTTTKNYELKEVSNDFFDEDES